MEILASGLIGFGVALGAYSAGLILVAVLRRALNWPSSPS